MSRTPFIYDDGSETDPATAVLSPAGALSAATFIESAEGDSLATVTERAYGYNSPGLRKKIKNANTTLKGTVRAPH